MKLVQIIVDYRILQFYALQIFLGARLHGGGGLYLALIFFNVTPQILHIVKFTA